MTLSTGGKGVTNSALQKSGHTLIIFTVLGIMSLVI